MAIDNFYVAPAGDISGGLSGLSQILQFSHEKREEAAKEEELRAEKAQMQTDLLDAWESQDANRMAEVSLRYPQVSAQASQALGLMQDFQKKEATDFAIEALSNPEKAGELAQRRTQLLTMQERNPADTQRFLEQFQEDPEAALMGLEMNLAAISPEAYNAYRASKEAEVIEPYTDLGKANRDLANKLITPEQYAQATKPDESREMREDANGVLRYLDGNQEPVFPTVAEVATTLADKDRFDQAKVIRSEITNDTKDFTQIANAWDRIAASANEPSAAGDLALIFNYMKMLDPGSTVREGEFANAQNAASIPSRIRNQYNRAISGERLNPEQRTDFFNQSENIFEASKNRRDSIVEEYVRLAERAGLSREDVVVERGDAPHITPPGELTQSALAASVTPEEWALMTPDQRAVFP